LWFIPANFPLSFPHENDTFSYPNPISLSNPYSFSFPRRPNEILHTKFFSFLSSHKLLKVRARNMKILRSLSVNPAAKESLKKVNLREGKRFFLKFLIPFLSVCVSVCKRLLEKHLSEMRVQSWALKILGIPRKWKFQFVIKGTARKSESNFPRSPRYFCFANDTKNISLEVSQRDREGRAFFSHEYFSTHLCTTHHPNHHHHPTSLKHFPSFS
jgi:hypothetical protein